MIMDVDMMDNHSPLDSLLVCSVRTAGWAVLDLLLVFLSSCV